MFHPQNTTAAVAITLALTASLAPAASADPAPPARAEAAIAATYGSAVVRSNPDNQAAQTAGAYSGPCSENCSGGALSYGSTSQLASTPSQSSARLPHDPPPLRVAVPGAYGTGSGAPTVVLDVPRSGGMHWYDAGIGTAAAVGPLTIGVAGIRTATPARNRHTGRLRAIATN